MRSLRLNKFGRYSCEPLESRRLLAIVTYTIDPTRSSVSVDTANSFFTGPSQVEPQRTGSETVPISGQIVADLVGTTLTFQPETISTATQSPVVPPAFEPPSST